MRIASFLLLFFVCLTSCNNRQAINNEDLLVEVEGNYLYGEELKSVMPFGLSPDDSLLFAESYIRNWVEDVLLYQKAENNIPDTEEIERLVENYRKALVVNAYQQALIDQRLNSDISEQEIVEFYESHKDLFVASRPLIKGLFLKIPLTAPQVTDVRKWYKSETHEAVENLEKYSFQNAVNYDYFYDKWTPLSGVLGKIPLQESDPEAYINKNRHVELEDTAFYYFLNVTDYLGSGQQEPYEFARIPVKDMLLNLKRVNFIKEIKDDLYKGAVKKDQIKYKY